MICDMHIHTKWSSDSKESVCAQVEQAIRLGMKFLCITDHQDYDQPVFPPDNYTFLIGDVDRTEEYIEDLQFVREKYQDQIRLLIGVELGLQPHLTDKLYRYVKNYPFDFVIGSTHNFHRHGADDLRIYQEQGLSTIEICKSYFEEEYKNIKTFTDFDVVGHLDFIFRYAPNAIETFSYETYADVLDPILTELIRSGRGIEVNTSRMKSLQLTNPKKEIIQRYAELGGEIITFGADSHVAADLGSCFAEAGEMVKECGLKYYAVYEQRKPKFYKI